MITILLFLAEPTLLCFTICVLLICLSKFVCRATYHVTVSLGILFSNMAVSNYIDEM